MVIQQHQKKKGEDYRFEIKPNPVEALRDRKNDNVEIARTNNRSPIH
jgi:hypothetical protein